VGILHPKKNNKLIEAIINNFIYSSLLDE